MVAANFADLDFLPGFLLDKPGEFHHGPSHSLLTAVIGGILICLAARTYFSEVSQKRLLLIFLVAAVSHPVLDVLSLDVLYPRGVPLFWPVNETHQISPVPVFSNVTRSQDSNLVFIVTFLSRHNLMNVLTETLFSAAMIAGISAAKNRIPLPRFVKLFALSFVCGLLFLVACLTLT